MLYEVKKSEAKDGKRSRRWFTCELFDLYIWSNNEGEIEKIQICFKPPYTLSPDDDYFEKVLTWEQGKHYSFDKVVYAQRYSTPILEKADPFDIDQFKSRFSDLSCNIDLSVQEFVKTKLNELDNIRES